MRILAAIAAGLLLAPAERAGGPAAPERALANSNQAAAGRLKGGVLVLRLEAREGRWYPEADDGPSEVVHVFAEEGKAATVPGPMVRVPQGTTVQLTIRNALDSTLVLHGMTTRPGNAGDSLVVPVGETREARFPAGAPGTYYYWGSTTGAGIEGREWLDSQLSGAFIVDAPGTVTTDRVFVLGMWFRESSDSSGPAARPYEDLMVINGKSWPHTERFTYTVGDSVRWRWINATESSHPMHLHGFYYSIQQEGDGLRDRGHAPDARPFLNTHLMMPGSTMTISWQAQREGNWVFHCHFAFHVSHHLLMEPHDSAHAAGRPHRMAGLVIGLHVNPAPRAPAAVTAYTARHLRLLMQEVPKRYDSAVGFGFVLQDPRAGVPRDSAPSDSVPMAGPTIVLTRGEPVAITVVNRMKQMTGVHWHGIELESFPDGIPGWSGTPGRIMPPVAPGDSFVAEFVPPRSGTFLYHSHSNEDAQISSGLYGALLVLEPGQTIDPHTDLTFVVGGTGPFPNTGLLNGTAEPRTLALKAGTTYRLRLIQIQPDWRVHFTLVGPGGLATWKAIAKDGADLPPALRTVRPARVLAGPGETSDYEFTPSEPALYRLEINTWATGWHLVQPIQVVD